MHGDRKWTRWHWLALFGGVAAAIYGYSFYHVIGLGG